MSTSTTDFGKFDLLTFNRPIVERHVRRLAESITEHGYQEDKPITVYQEEDGKLVVTDGQHRLTACKQLNEPVFYVVKPKKDAVGLIIDENNTQFRWSNRNYIHFYANPESPYYNENYKFIVDLANAYQVTEDSVLNACRRVSKGMVGTKRTTYSGLQPDVVKRGKMQLPHMSLERIKSVLDNVKDIERVDTRFRGFKNKSAFTNAAIDIVTHPQYKHTKMLKKLTAYPGEVNSAGGKDKYKEQFAAVYNRNQKKSHKIDFFDGRAI